MQLDIHARLKALARLSKYLVLSLRPQTWTCRWASGRVWNMTGVKLPAFRLRTCSKAHWTSPQECCSVHSTRCPSAVAIKPLNEWETDASFAICLSRHLALLVNLLKTSLYQRETSSRRGWTFWPFHVQIMFTSWLTRDEIREQIPRWSQGECRMKMHVTAEDPWTIALGRSLLCAKFPWCTLYIL